MAHPYTMRLWHYTCLAAQWLRSHISVVFLLWATWLAFEYFGFGPASYVRVHDNADSHLSAMLGWVSALRGGDFGWWDAQWVCGTDRIAVPYTGELDSLVFLALPGWLAYGLIMWLQRFVAGYFTFRVLRDSVGLHTLPSVYGGLVYSIFAQNAVNCSWAGFTLYDGFALPGLPFLLWSLPRLGSRSRLGGYACAAGLGLLLSATSLYHLAVFLTPLMGFWVLFIAPKPRRRLWLMLLLFAGAWLAGEVYVLWPTLLNAPLSHRADWGPSAPVFRGTAGALSLVAALVRDNGVPLALAGVGVMASRGRDRRLAALLAGLALCLVFVGVWPWARSKLYTMLGPLAGFQFDRFYLLVPFLATAAGVAGVSLLSREWRLALFRNGRHYRDIPLRNALVAGAIGLVVLQSFGIKHRTLKEMADGSTFASIYRQADLERLAESREQLAPFRVVTVVDASRPNEHPAYTWAYGVESADGYVPLYSQRYQDYWEHVISRLTDVDRRRYDYFHYWGSRVYLFSPSDGFACEPEVQFDEYYDLELLSLANVRYIISPRPLKDEHLRLLPSAVREEQLAWVGRRRRDLLLSMVRGTYPGTPLYIYENSLALPRFFLAGEARSLDGPQEVLTALGQASRDELRSTAYVECGDVSDLPLGLSDGKTGTVSVRSYSADRISLDVTAESPSVLIASNSYSPYWTASVDGIATTVIPVDHTFQGVYVEAGQHEVVLEYAPPYAVALRR